MRSLVPTKRLAVALVAAGLVLFVVPPSAAAWVFALVAAVLVVAVAADLLSMPSARELAVERSVAGRLSLGAANLVQIGLENNSDRPLRCLLRDAAPAEFSQLEPGSLIAQVAAPPRGSTVHRYHVTPSRRGRYEFGDVHLRLRGALGLVDRQLRFEAALDVDVYPNIKAVSKYQLLARKGALLEMGIKSIRMAGLGTEFESLREYQPDDEFRRIDWKATARRGKPITQVREAERSQSILLAIDSGRMMTPELDGVAKLDRAINAALMLAYVAIASGDNVGLLVFGREIQRYVAPARGRRQLLAILESLHAVVAEMSEPDYPRALQYLATRNPKRSLVVLFTDIWSREGSRRLLSAMVALRPRHLPLCVTLRDPSLDELLRGAPAGSADVYAQAVAEQLLVDREDARRTLISRGALVLDTTAEQLSIAAVNKYLEVKTAGLL